MTDPRVAELLRDHLERHYPVKARRLRLAARALGAKLAGTLYAYDAAYPPDQAMCAAKGGIAIVRYTPGPAPVYDWKRTDKAEIALARNTNHLGALANYEQSAGQALTGGRGGGRTAATVAAKDMIAFGWPQNGTLANAFSVDVNVPPDKYPAVRDWYLGVFDVLPGYRYVPKIYSQGGLIAYLCANGPFPHDSKHWLAAPTSWPGYNPSSKNVAMVQLVGSPVPGTDQNKIIDPRAMGFWWPTGSPYASPEDEVLDANDPIVKEIRASLGTIKDNTVLDTAHPGTPSLGEVYRLLKQTIEGDPNHPNLATLPALKAAMLAAIAEIPAGPPGPAGPGGFGPVTGSVSGQVTITPGV